jgi:hypothetical protein
MGSHDPFGHLKHKLWQFDSRPLKVRNCPDVLVFRWRATYVGKLSTRATTLLEISSQLEVCKESYGPPKLQESQVWEFQDSHLGVSKQNAIWMWASWRGTKYTIRGKVVASPKFGSWWILWVRVCSWLVLAPKVLQLCINQLVVWFCAGPCEWLSACHSS